MRERVAKRLGGTPRQHTRLMLAVWSLMHGTAMLIIRGSFEGALRTQTIHACLDAFDGILDSAARSKGHAQSGPKWPSNLILGEGKQSRVGNGSRGGRKEKSKDRKLRQSERLPDPRVTSTAMPAVSSRADLPRGLRVGGSALQPLNRLPSFFLFWSVGQDR